VEPLMTRIFAPLILILLATACSQSDNVPVENNIDLIVRCGLMIDGLAENTVDDKLIVIRDQRISAILPGDDPSMRGAEILDLSDHTCLPGLIDMHVHLDGLPEDADDYTIYLRRTPDDTQQLAEELAGIVLNAGFTTVRNVGTYKAWVARDLRDEIDAGNVAGPRIRIAGPYLTIPHGGGDMYIPGVDDSEIPGYYRTGVARGAEEFRARTEEIVAGGADFIKIIASGAVFGHGSTPGAPEMTFEEIVAVVEVADAAGIKVTAHAHSAESIKDAILAGVSSIEHASLGDDESVALALEHDVAFVMDVYNGTYTEEIGEAHGYAEEFMRKNEETTEAQREVFRKALAANVTLLFGTDLGVLPHAMGARQFAEMVKHGMPPMQAIKSATSLAAEHMGVAADVGALEVGRYGDLVAVRGNPLEDIAVLQNLSVVVKGGAIVNRQSVQATTDAHTK
jgi:imidazolonepropionase-like amidohydrolase